MSPLDAAPAAPPPPPNGAPDAPNQAGAFEAAVERETGQPVTWNAVTVYTTGPQAFAAMEAEMCKAKESIYANVYIWTDDSTGQRLGAAATDAVARGVAVRTHVDRLGSLFGGSGGMSKLPLQRFLPALAKALNAARKEGITLEQAGNILRLRKDPSLIYDFTPRELQTIQAIIDAAIDEPLVMGANAALRAMRAGGVDLRVDSNPITRIDHSKAFIFDKTVVYSGGMNIGDEYSGGYEEGKGWTGRKFTDAWKDYMIQMTGPASDVHRNVVYGEHVEIPRRKSGFGTPVIVLHNEPGDPPADPADYARKKQISHAIRRLLRAAQSEIIVEHAFLAHDEIIHMLIAAGERGVRVTVIRGQSDVKDPSLAAMAEKYFRKLEGKTNVRVLVSPRVLHAKLLCVDGIHCIVGSANLTMESLEYHEETSVLLWKSPAAQELYLQAQKSLRAALAYGMGGKA